MHHAFTLADFAVIYSPDFLSHDTGSFHPENAGRLTAVVAALEQAPWADHLDWREPTPLDRRDVDTPIAQLHNPRYIRALEQLAAAGGGQIDGDTVVSGPSYGVARLAVSAWLDGVDYVLETGHSAFVLARPPGHHAVRDRGMGFCLFANAAIAAHYALTQPGIARVAILDWDVHWWRTMRRSPTAPFTNCPAIPAPAMEPRPVCTAMSSISPWLPAVPAPITRDSLSTR